MLNLRCSPLEIAAVALLSISEDIAGLRRVSTESIPEDCVGRSQQTGRLTAVPSVSYKAGERYGFTWTTAIFDWEFNAEKKHAGRYVTRQRQDPRLFLPTFF